MNRIVNGITSLQNHWRDDLKAGFNVSLIALPLSLGIALASGFPPVAGLFAAIIGGMLVSRINGSYVTIVGPAAGLIVVNLGAIEVLGQGDNVAGYKYTLAAIFVAGILIVILGMLKAGKFGDFFPTSAVHGMLAAIGIIIMVKQFFVAVAVRAHGHEFYEILEEIPVALYHSNPEVVLISLVSLGILIFHPKVKNKLIRSIPSPLWVLLIAVPMEFLMDFEHEHEVRFLGEVHKVGPQLLVHLPDSVLDGIVTPDFGKVLTSAFWISVMTIALVTALESLLSAIAVDSLDTDQRKTDLDKDLRGLGAGSSVSGLIGGLPMISEIVRSSANVSSGAKTQWANFFHGSFLLIFLLVGGPLINHIPLSALAAMLLFTGYRLASPKEFKHVYKIGRHELIVFVSTIVMVLVTDLLIGVGVGIAINLLINVVKGTSIKNLFKVHLSEEVSHEHVTLKVANAIVFSNYLGLKKRILKHSDQSIILDLAGVKFIDHSAINQLKKLERDFKGKGLSFKMVNDEHLRPETDHPLSSRILKVGEKTSVVKSYEDNIYEKLADNFQGEYSASKTVDWNDLLKRFHFNKSGRIHYTLNHIDGRYGSFTYHFQEVEFDSDIRTQSSTEKFPVVILSPSIGNLPVFTLEKEEFYDKIIGLAGWDDIDFDNHPVFSDRFLLKGDNEFQVRKFFNEAIIEFFEEQPEYHFESDGSRLLIFRFDKDKSPSGIMKLMEFAEKLSEVMDKSNIGVTA